MIRERTPISGKFRSSVPDAVAAVDLDVRRLPQDHLSFVAHLITVMIKARVTRIWPCWGAQR
jgi:hypothetical protein